MIRYLLERIRQLDQSGFRPCTAEESYSGRKLAANEAHWNADRRESGPGGQRLTVIAGRRIEIADKPRRIVPRWIHDGGNTGLVHCPDNDVTALLLNFPAHPPSFAGRTCDASALRMRTSIEG